jgi:hypothetical protein
MTDENIEMKVHVSGTTVYKAVKNYLNNSVEFSKMIDEKAAAKFDDMIQDGYMLKQAVYSYLSDKLLNRYGDKQNFQDMLTRLIKSEIKKVVDETVKESLNEVVIKACLKEVLKKLND